MKILTQQLEGMVCGSSWCEECEDGLVFHRFTAEQSSIYQAGSGFYSKCCASSGISLNLEIEATGISFDWAFTSASSRRFAWFDLLLDGVLASHQGTDDYEKNPTGHFSFQIPSGRHRVELDFPCLAKAAIQNVQIDDVKYLAPLPAPEKTILFLGDSITQGYCAAHSSVTIPNLVARGLGMGKLCRAIGGEMFNPCIPGGERQMPSLIFSAYGTNDWSNREKEVLRSNAERYFAALHECYPGIPVFVLLPIWRKDSDEIKRMGSFRTMVQEIRDAAKVHPRIYLQDGYNLIPHSMDYFCPDGLHPKDAGFQTLGKALVQVLSDIVKN